MIDRHEVRRIEHRIAKAERRLARGVDIRQEVLRGAVSEAAIQAALKTRLAEITQEG